MSVLLLVSEKPDDHAFATEAAKASDLRVQKAKDVIDATSIIDTEANLRAIFVDASTEMLYRAFEGAIQEKFGIFSDKINANQIHFLCDNTMDESPYLTSSPLFGHYVVRRQYTLPENAQHYGRVVAATLKDRAFGLQNLMKPGTKIQIVKLANSQMKGRAVEAVKNYMVAAKFQSRIASVVANAVDELLMNAIFSAPTDELGKPIYTNTPRNTPLKLEGKSAVEVQLGYDGVFIGISAVDRYGSVDKLKLLSHVSKTYTDEQYRVKMSQAGAGVGLSMVNKMGGSFFYASEFQERTEATVFFRRTNSYRDFKSQFQFFSTQFYH